MYVIEVLIITTLSITVSFCRLYNPRINIKTLSILIGLIVINLILCININSSLFIPLIFIIFILISFAENRQAISYNIFISIVCLLLVLINDAISFTILNQILGIDYTKTLNGILIYGFLNIILAYGQSSIVANSLNMLLKEKVFSKQGKKILIIIFNIIFSFIVIAISYYINKVYIGLTNKLFSTVYLLIIIGYSASAIGTAYFFYSSYKNEIKIKLDEEEMKRIIEYSTIIDDMYMGIRKFKHDYINILSSINSYIDDKKWDDLEIYFKEHILSTRQVVTKNDSISKLSNLKVIYLKALISSKIVKAENLGIKTYVDISEEVSTLNVSPIDICRVIGILLDNAIEGSLESNDKFLKFGMVHKGNSIVIIVENSCGKDIPPRSKMLEKNFSTKGKDRGLGLYNLVDILSKYDNITHTLNIENDLFTSEIWLRVSREII